MSGRNAEWKLLKKSFIFLFRIVIRHQCIRRRKVHTNVVVRNKTISLDWRGLCVCVCVFSCIVIIE